MTAHDIRSALTQLVASPLPQQLGQLGDVGRNPPRLVLGHEIGRRSTSPRSGNPSAG
jgi:hypothetical protein